MSDLLVPLDSGHIFVDDRGVGPPLLVMPVAWGMSYDFYSALLDPTILAARLVFYDPVGVGRSSPLPEDWRPERIVSDAEEVREALGIEQVILFGHASGGYQALSYALRFPDHVAGMILVNGYASYRRADETGAPLLEHVDTWPRFRDRVREIRRVKLPAAEEFRAVYKEQRMVDLLDYSPHYLRMAEIADRTGFNPAMHDDIDGDVTDRLAEIRAPTLIVAGLHDALCPFTESQLLAECLPAASLVPFALSRHFPFVEQPVEFGQAVRDFIHALGLAAMSASDLTPDGSSK